MKREQFPISAESFELLLAFEQKSSLEGLASIMGKDPSVISRNLQRLAEELPVLKKENRKWTITDLGKNINILNRRYLAELSEMIEADLKSRKNSVKKPLLKNSCLLIINAQTAILSPDRLPRNNTEAEKNILSILEEYRTQNRPITHIKHISGNPESPFHPSTGGTEIIPLLTPATNEIVIEKSKASAFLDTSLLQRLQENSIDTLVLTGFTGNECIDATARDACALGFETHIISDATATFDLVGPEGKVQKADRVHRLVLATLQALYARVISTSELLKLLK